MGLSQNGLLLIVSAFGAIGLCVAFVCMPSDQYKLDRMENRKNKKYFAKGDEYLSPEELRKFKEKQKSGQQLWDAIRNAAKKD